MSRQRFGDLSGFVRGAGFGLPDSGTAQPPQLGWGIVTIAPDTAESQMTIRDQLMPGAAALIVPAGNWQDRSGALPSVGTSCIFIKDGQGDVWVPMWKP